jgi:putative nucleotidyltransferase with HDIG domain
MASRLKLRTGDWIDLLLVSSLTASVGILLVGLFSWQNPFGSRLQLQVGEVAPHDVVAPRQITYESQVFTERARERAAQGVPDQYDNPDGRVRRQQVEQARKILEYISIVRNDAYTTPELQADYLAAIASLSLTPELIQQILAITPEEWSLVVEDVPLTLDRAMREEIRESSLSAARRRVPALMTGDLSEPAAAVVAELVRLLIRPNSVLNQARTDELRENARQEVPAQPVTYERNEIILRAGDIAAAEHVEALTQIGLIQDEWNWWVSLRGLLFTLALLAVIGGTLYRLHPRTIHNLQEYGLLVVMVVIWLLAAKLMLIPHDWLPYLYPLAALGMLVAVLIDLRVAVITIIAFAIVGHFLAGNNAPLVAYLTLGSLVGAIILGRAERLTAFLWAGVAVAVCNLLVIAAFWAPFEEYVPSRMLQLLLVVLLNGGLSASIAMIGYLVLGNLFGITTSLQLTELSRPTHPLLRQLLLKASGTYHHTILVSNLAERAAAAIGADAFLTRVGAYYHDIGKTVRPYFFTENIVDGNSPHDKLDPLTSAQIIISHISDGIDLANKYHLPPRIQDFIREHHGRTLVKYFFVQAEREAGEGELVDEADFRYPGPNPRSKETAILFLADTCEAAVRAMHPATREELEALVDRLIDERIAEGELNDCNLTFRELQITKEVFIQVLQGLHHPRIQYPEPAVLKAKPREGGADSQASGATLPLPGGVEEPAGV